MYIFIGILLGSIVTSTHGDKEACLGRKAILQEKGVIGDCVPEPFTGIYLGNSYSGSSTIPYCVQNLSGKCVK